MPTVCVHLMTQEDLAAVEKLNLWEEAIETKGISKCHHAEMKDGILSIWKHAADVINDPINTVIYEYQKSLQSSSVEVEVMVMRLKSTILKSVIDILF